MTLKVVVDIRTVCLLYSTVRKQFCNDLDYLDCNCIAKAFSVSAVMRSCSMVKLGEGGDFTVFTVITVFAVVMELRGVLR